jgi:hypothetical protein
MLVFASELEGVETPSKKRYPICGKAQLFINVENGLPAVCLRWYVARRALLRMIVVGISKGHEGSPTRTRQKHLDKGRTKWGTAQTGHRAIREQHFHDSLEQSATDILSQPTFSVNTHTTFTHAWTSCMCSLLHFFNIGG